MVLFVIFAAKKNDFMSYSKEVISKVGNAMVYMAEHVPELSKTKLLKLLYLLEEESVKKNKLPFFGIPFEIWQAGPVANPVFFDLGMDTPALFADFITTIRKENATYILSVAPFDSGEFSDNDLAVMDDVIKTYGHWTAFYLVEYLHGERTAWYKKAKETGLLEAFEKEMTNRSDYEIDFTVYLSESEAERYRDCMYFHQSVSHLKP